MKECKGCKEIKSLDQYFNQKRNKDGKFACCKVCTYVDTKKWQDANREKVNLLSKQYRLKDPVKYNTRTRELYQINKDHINDLKRKSRRKQQYGLTEEDYFQLVESQNSLCKICGVHASTQ